ncbi:MAG: hypothetical protein RBR59_00800 [Sulfurimonadaceae bacterium]|nr:hypothetical protein [Sulfurimonadaceae bacterium]
MRQNKDGEQRLSRLFGRFSIVAILSINSLYAASFEDFKKTQSESFQKYKDERDNQFNKYLKEQWKAYNVYKGTPLYEEPKPATIKPAIKQPLEKVGPTIYVQIKEVPKVEIPKEIVKQELPKLIDKPIVMEKPKAVDKSVVVEKPTIIEKPQEKVKEIVKVIPKRDIEFDFFGMQLGFDISNGLKSASFQPTNKAGIANFFDKAASSEYTSLVEQIQQTKKELALNDWGVYLLVKEIAQQTYSNQNEADLLSWFLFNKLGYSVKVGLAKDKIVLMHYSKKIIYSTPNYTINQKKYYVIANYNKGSVGQLYSYEQNYPGADKPLDLALPTLPLLSQNKANKVLQFEYGVKKYKIPFEYNKNLIDFMATYPQADYETFFNAPLEAQTYESIAKELKKIVDGKKASEAMNIVLSFVQKSFDYQTDEQQFGREKVMFALETLYFDKSDCEDRAILFSYLTKELFGVDILGVKYKDHMATALYVPLDGDKVKYSSKEYVLADPTYINANIGQSMPKYKPLIPESFVTVKN